MGLGVIMQVFGISLFNRVLKEVALLGHATRDFGVSLFDMVLKVVIRHVLNMKLKVFNA